MAHEADRSVHGPYPRVRPGGGLLGIGVLQNELESVPCVEAVRTLGGAVSFVVIVVLLHIHRLA